jgi:hypothetical protein
VAKRKSEDTEEIEVEAIEEPMPDEPVPEEKSKKTKNSCPSCGKRGQQVFGLYWDETRKLPVDAYACDGCKTIYFQ